MAETVLELDTDVLDDTEPEDVMVDETNDDDEVEEDTLGVILADPEEELLDETLIVELDETDIDELVQPDDDTLPDWDTVTLELLVNILDDVKLVEAHPETEKLPEADEVGIGLVDAE